MTRPCPHPAEPAAQGEQRYCVHELCRHHAIEDLLFMARVTGRADILQMARDVPTAVVVCRQLARKGPIRAPLPSRPVLAVDNAEHTGET